MDGLSSAYLPDVHPHFFYLSISSPPCHDQTDSFRRLGVLSNVDTPEDAVVARANGAEGIGLCRTEHMFFSRCGGGGVGRMG